MTEYVAKRITGDRYQPGGFRVTDSDGVEWQATVVESTITPGALVCPGPAVCLNHDCHATAEVGYHIVNAVRNVLASEAWGRDERAKVEENQWH
jgi:hypothetical protein